MLKAFIAQSKEAWLFCKHIEIQVVAPAKHQILKIVQLLFIFGFTCLNYPVHPLI